MIAMACDMTIASEDALFTHPGFRYIGPTTDLGLMLSVMGLKKMKEMVLTGRAFNAQEALECGIVNKIVSRDKLEEEVMKYAEAATALPFDGIVLGKAFMQGVLESAGVGLGDYIGMLGHALQTGIHYEPGEYNLLKERRDKGIKGAITEREGKWAPEFDLRSAEF